VDIPPEKGFEIGLYIPKAVIVPFSEPFFSGYSTEEAFKKKVYTFQIPPTLSQKSPPVPETYTARSPPDLLLICS